MTVKEWLEQYKRIVAKIKALQRDIDKLTAAIGGGSLKTDVMPRSTGLSDQTGKIAAELADIKRKKEQLLLESWRRREEIEAVIMAVKDPIYITLLHDRYIELMSWDEITVDLGLSNDQYVRGKLHQKALREIRRIVVDSDQGGQ